VFFKKEHRTAALTLLCLLFFVCSFLYSVLQSSVSEFHQWLSDRHSSSAAGLQGAQEVCKKLGPSGFTCAGDDLDRAVSMLEKIGRTAPDYSESQNFLSALRSWKQALDESAAKHEREAQLAAAQAKQERDRLTSQTEEESKEQLWRNTTGQAHDAFTCAMSSENSPIMSFDYGHYWWTDDGRCGPQEEKLRQAREQTEEQNRKAEQERRDSDAKLESYWPTTLRVDTDINSSWLNDEERTCQTFPDSNGKVTSVVCNGIGSRTDHNIPIKFWGGVERNTASSWRCRREKELLSDSFVCKAIN
jgi:hypothetical protein